jgi:hypothetical protein
MLTNRFINDVHMLIYAYIECSKYACSLLSKLYNGEETYLRAKVLKLIPKEGYVDDMYFKFHGSGCYFDFPGTAIDIDFGTANRCDGFDIKKLEDFFSCLADKEKYPTLSSRDSFAQQFEELKQEQVIARAESNINEYLYYLVEQG